jgi:deazaflavin-dependent oxidoreductase (nitroreductase family)
MGLPQEEPLDNAIGWVAKHTRRYIESGGAEGHEWNGATTLVLTTKGRRSGRLRHNALIYVEDEGTYYVVASFGGKPHHPAWYLNLDAEPDVRIQVRDRVMDATAQTVEGSERELVWPVLLEMWPDYAEYQTRTTRRFPVVKITPAA